MNPFNIIKLLDSVFYSSIINYNSLEDTIVPGSSNTWHQLRSYANATSRNLYNKYFSISYYDTRNAVIQKDLLNYTGSYSALASLRPSITFVE